MNRTIISRKQLQGIIKEELRLLKEEDYDSYRDSRRERGLGGKSWKSKQASKRNRADKIKKLEQVRAQGREDALAGLPKDESIKHLAYGIAYDEALSEV